MLSKKLLIQWQKSLAELVFPPRCLVCAAAGEEIDAGLCSACLANVPYISDPLCSVCGRNFAGTSQAEHICEKCLHHNPGFSMARAITYYEEPVRGLLHGLKYKFKTATVAPLLKIAQSFNISPFESCDVFLPVPLHQHKLKKRGMNQALVLTQLLFPQKRTHILPEVLLKTRNTLSQTELDGAGRRANLKGVFVIKHPEIIENRRICIVDDIYTTGTTVRECARTLVDAGAAEVKVLTFARVRELK